MLYLSDRITLSPDLCNGKPTIRGMRITVETVLGYLSVGDSAEEVLAEYPMLKAADIQACLQFATKMPAQLSVM